MTFYALAVACLAAYESDPADPVAQIRQFIGKTLPVPYDVVESVTSEKGVTKVSYRYTFIHGRPGIVHINEYRRVVTLETKADAIDLLRMLQGKKPLPESSTSRAYNESQDHEKAVLVNCRSEFR